MTIDPLPWGASIVDANFRPTPSFQRQWNLLVDLVNSQAATLALLTDFFKVSYAPTLTAAKALFGASTVLSNGASIVMAGSATVGDGSGGIFSYDASDTTTVFATAALGFTDNQGRRFKRVGPSTLLLTAGTVGAPALSHDTDTDSGIYFPAANQVGIVVGGAQVMGFTATLATLANRTTFGVAAEGCSINGAVAIGGTLSLGVTGGAASGFPGLLIVSNSSQAIANVNTQTLYSVVSARGSAATFASLGTGNGSGGGCSFTVSCTGNGAITVTNTSGVASNVEIAFFGALTS